MLDTLLKGRDYVRSMGPLYPAIIAIGVAILLAGMLTRNERVHATLVIVAFLSLGLAITNVLASVK